MPPPLTEQIEQLKSTIASMEAQRGSLGDAVVEAALAPLKRRLGELSTQIAGSEAPAEAETVQQRKLVTLLFMDIAGSTSITQHMDPEDVSDVFDAALKKLAAPVEAHGGRVTRFMGDGFLAVFGAPLAREDDPERAVRAGLEIIELSSELATQLQSDWGFSPFRVRVGINTGLVLLGGQTEAQDTLMGAAVNLAARLESAAPPGGMLISHDTYRHIRGVFDVEALEPIRAKGFDQPVQVYRVVSSRPRAFRLYTRGVEGVETRMVGRETELKCLQDALITAIEKGEGQMVTITGDAGVGKSRLLYEFQDWIELLPPPAVRFFEGRARQEAQGLPYGLLRNLFAFRFQIQDNDGVELARQKIMSGFAEVFGSEPDGEMHAHILGQWLGYDFGTSAHLKVVLSDPEQLRNRGLLYLGEYFKRLSGQAPVVIYLEDIHWADDSSLDAFSRLGEQVSNQRLLIVCAARPTLFERCPHWGKGSPFQSCINLQPLSQSESHQLVMEVLKFVEHIPEELGELVVKGAEGNPFYVEELIKMLVEAGIVVKGEDAWHISPQRLSEIEVPPTLVEVLQARLDSLPPQERAVLQQASVVGRLFWDRVVAHIQAAGGSSLQVVPETLSSLCGRELIYCRAQSTFADAREYLFKHDMLREVTYETVLKRLRRVYHGYVADWLIAHSTERIGEFSGLIAMHLELAGQAEQAIRYLSLAGDQAVRQYANREAIEYYRRALKLIAEAASGDKISAEFISTIQESLGDTYAAIGQQEQATDALQNAFTLIPVEDYLGRARLKRKLGRMWQDQGKYEPAYQEYAEAESLLGQLSSESAREAWQEWVEIQVNRLMGYYALAQADKIAELVNKIQPAIEHYGTPQQHADFYASQARMYFRRDRYVVSEELLTIGRKLFSTVVEFSDKQRVGSAHFELGFTLLWHGDYDEAERMLRMGLELSEQCSDLYTQTLCLTYLSILCRLLGRIEEGQAYISRSLETANERKMINYLAAARGNQAWVYWREGDLAKAEVEANAALDLWGQVPFVYPFHWTALWPLLAIAVEKGQLERAIEYARGLLKPEQQRLPDKITETLEAVIYAVQDDQPEAAHLGLKKALELAQEFGYL